MSTKTAGQLLRYTVSGPGTDKSYETAGVALSAAITAAEHHVGAATFYVRDLGGDVVYRVEHDEHGATKVHRTRAVA